MHAPAITTPAVSIPHPVRAPRWLIGVSCLVAGGLIGVGATTAITDDSTPAAHTPAPVESDISSLPHSADAAASWLAQGTAVASTAALPRSADAAASWLAPPAVQAVRTAPGSPDAAEHWVGTR